MCNNKQQQQLIFVKALKVPQTQLTKSLVRFLSSEMFAPYDDTPLIFRKNRTFPNKKIFFADIVIFN